MPKLKPNSSGEKKRPSAERASFRRSWQGNGSGDCSLRRSRSTRANQLRVYVESALLRTAEMPITQSDFDKWAMWARQEADRIDPVKNGTIARAIKEHSDN
jgi:hypothetical protein